MMTLWMKVTPDRYELPVAVGDTAEQLARLVGCTKNNIYSAISNATKHGYRCQYIKVTIEEDSEC